MMIINNIVKIPIYGIINNRKYNAMLLYDGNIFSTLSSKCRDKIILYNKDTYSPNALATILTNRSIDAWLWFKDVETDQPIDRYRPFCLQIPQRWFTV